MLGPNVKKLIAHKMAIDAVPHGGGLQAAIDVLVTPGALSAIAKKATAWVEEAIAVVKTAPDNPWGGDDEAIAGAILKRIEITKRKPVEGR